MARNEFHLAIFYTVISVCFLSETAFAATNGVDTALLPPTAQGTLFEFVTEVLKIVIKIGIPVVALALLISGFMFLTAQGNETKLADAKKAITWTVIGGAILLCSVTIATVIKNTIGQLGG
ncbi:MAG: hypothetical protein WC878_02430 [Candidatus Paceibacterota bacterium]|jgi:hypothetical protein